MSEPSPPFSVLNAAGELVGEHPFSVDDVREMFQGLVAARAYDTKASSMQRQGRLATYAPFTGQEAAQIGAVAALQPNDWVVATYRDAAAMWAHGYPWVNLILGRTGDERGGCAPDGVNVLPPSITVGGHMIHAVGIAWAAKIRKHPSIAMTFFGDGATSEGDFHEAINFAGVYATPCVFLCQNNGWAISMPFSGQTAAESIVAKAAGYGVQGVQVDGNDVLAVRMVSAAAADRARQGGGPTLIEAMTYRVAPHTTTDDDSRYRDQAEIELWMQRDPLARVRTYLKGYDAWSPDWEQEIADGEAAAVEQAVLDAEALEPMTSDEIFTAMFAEPTPQLEEQAARARGDHRD